MILGILNNPRATLEAAAQERQIWVAAGIVALWALLNLVLTVVFVFGGGLQEQFAGLSPQTLDRLLVTLELLAPVSAFLLPFVWWVGVSALMLLATRLFGGRTDYSPMLAVVGAACVPWVAGYAIQVPIGVLQLLLAGQGGTPAVLGTLAFIVSTISLAWHIGLVIVGARVAAGTSYRGAGGSCALTGLGCATAGFILLVTVLTLIFGLSGAT